MTIQQVLDKIQEFILTAQEIRLKYEGISDVRFEIKNIPVDVFNELAERNDSSIKAYDKETALFCICPPGCSIAFWSAPCEVVETIVKVKALQNL